MKTLLALTLVLAVPGWGWLLHVHERNEALAAAQAAHQQHQALAEAAAWTRVAAQAPATPSQLLNLAHAQLRASQLEVARATYERLLNAPATVGSVARQQLAVLAVAQGQAVAALGLLREALRLNPYNAVARYNYEVLRAYLDQQQPDGGASPPPGGAGPKPPAAANKPDASAGSRPKPKPGTDHPEQMPTPNQPGTGDAPPQPRPTPTGQPNAPIPGLAGGNAAASRRPPGTGPAQPVPMGEQPGQQRGLDPSAEMGTDAPPGTSVRPGTAAARAADLRLQTQRERLRALNLTPAQARQVLEALRAQEQQYLQQLTRPAPDKPESGKPTW